MAGSLQGKVLVLEDIYPQNATSDGVLGKALPVNGYNRVLVHGHAGIVSTGDSDDTLTFTLQKNTSSSASTDASWTAITAGTIALTASADTDTALGEALIDFDLVKHGLTTGWLRLSAVPSEGGVAAVASTMIFYRPTGKHTDSGMTITVPASS